MGNRLMPREGSSPSTIAPGVWIAVGVAGGIILIALVCMIWLLVRATRAHKRLLADLEQRGIRLGQQHVQLEGNGVTKPRQVLRRNTFLPYNNISSGWGVLPSRESFGQSSVTKIPQTMQTPTIIEPVPSPTQSTHKKVWPFHKRRSRGPKHIKLERIRTSRLSAIIESPRPMFDVPSQAPQERRDSAAGSSPRLRLDSTFDSPIERLCPPSFGSNKPNSAPDLTSALRPAPLFSNPVPSPSGTVIRSPRRRGRSNSVPSVYSTNENTREILPSNGSSKLGRNFSLIYRQSGLAPDSPVPPLPLRLGHTRSVSNVDYSPSRRSASSFESATSSILVANSPATQRSPHARMRQSPGHELHKSLVLKGPRPLPQVQSRNSVEKSTPQHFRDESIRSNVAQFALEVSSSNPHSRNGSGDSKADVKLKIESNSMGHLSLRSRSNNSLTGGTPSTPRRNSRTLVSADGSPTERHRAITHQEPSATEGVLAQQLSRTSTNASSSCSSNGNPFQWDPTPMQSGKPAIPKMSPERKKAHRRQNCIRLSLSTGQAGPPLKAESSAVMHGIEEEPGSAHKKKPSGESEMISLDTRPLPRPPSISVFAPEIRLSPTSIRASLTPGSPTLSLTRFNQENPDGSPRWRNSAVSGSSAFSIPTFPSPVHTNASQLSFMGVHEKDSTSGASHTIDDGAAGFNKQGREYDPVSPLLTYPVLDMPSPKTVEQEFRSATPPPKHERKRSQVDSPSCSPKTLIIKSQETTPIDPSKRAKTMSSPVPALPSRDPRRSSEISPTRAGLTGPRAEPARDLRKTVAALRRMNSDAKDDSRTSRRYRQLGREATSANLVDETHAGAASASSPTKAVRESKARRTTKGFGSPSKHFVPASTYSLVCPPPPPSGSHHYHHHHHHHHSVAPSVSTSHTSTVFSSSSAPTARTSTATANTTPPPTAPSRSPTRPAFGLGLALGIGAGGVGGGLGCSSLSSNSLTLTEGGMPFGEDSCTSLTDLILAENENIFGKRELEMANGDVFTGDGAAKDRPSSRVWEDGEGFWESPSAKEMRAREVDDSPSVYDTPILRPGGARGRGRGDTVEVAEDDAAAAVGCVDVGGGEQEFFDSDAENKTPTGKTGGKEEGRRRASGRERGAGEREVLAPKVLISVQPPSEQGTPQSLYDRDGFLR